LFGDDHSTEPREYLSQPTIIIITAIVEENQRTKEVALWIAFGISSKEISQFLNLSLSSQRIFVELAAKVSVKNNEEKPNKI